MFQTVWFKTVTGNKGITHCYEKSKSKLQLPVSCKIYDLGNKSPSSCQTLCIHANCVCVGGGGPGRRKIRLIEGNAKCRHLKKLTYKGTLRQVFICWGPEPHTPPSFTLYTCIQYTYSHRERGEEERVEPGRRFEAQQFTKLGRKYQHDWLWLYLQSANSDKHLPQSPFTGQFY